MGLLIWALEDGGGAGRLEGGKRVSMDRMRHVIKKLSSHLTCGCAQSFLAQYCKDGSTYTSSLQYKRPSCVL